MAEMPTLEINPIKDYSIYRITNPVGRIYIGVTCDFKKRMSCYNSKATSKSALIYSSMKKYGFKYHNIEIIDSFKSTASYASDKEMFWIRSHMSNRCKYPELKGLNLCDGGKAPRGHKMKPEQKEKIRQIKLGKKASAETKMKMRQAMLGRKTNIILTEEQKQNLREKCSKYRHTEEAKSRIGAASKGNKYRLGKYLTEAEKQHLSKLNKNKKLSATQYEAHCDRIRKACGRCIIQYNLNGEFIKEYPMIIIAVKETGIPRINIQRNLSGEYKQTRGYIFKYKN